MTSLNLTQRIWLSVSALILLVEGITAVVYPLSIQSGLKEQTYERIEYQQARTLRNPPSGGYSSHSGTGPIKQQDAARSVEHLLLTKGDEHVKDNPVLKEMATDAYKQKQESGRYTYTYSGVTFFYVVRRVKVHDQHAYFISYMLDTYRNEMMKALWKRLLWILLLAGILGLAMTLWLSRYLRKPLILLGNRFEEISNRHWEKSFEWKKDDEFGRLSEQFEHMRQNLVRHDESQKTFIQHASHELKTPIMIINSYAQSVKDGVMPKKSLPETMDVIISESERMDKRVRELIYYTKLDALKDETPHREKVPFGPTAADIIDRLSVGHEGVTFNQAGDDTVFDVDPEQLKELIENLIENALRYAEGEIQVIAHDAEGESVLEIYNDGASIPEDEHAHMFDPFYKGAKGKFGLGLAIVHRIVALHHGQIDIENQDGGVSFIARFPKSL